jgi:Domain of unknown function (DUF1707)
MSDAEIDVRASDAERDRTAQDLSAHAGEGRLTLAELSERVDAAYAARTRGELEALVRDLPSEAAPADAVASSRRRPLRWTVAVMSGSHRRGRMRIAGRSTVLAVMGGAALDLREAEIDRDAHVVAVSVMGGIDIRVPAGVDVRLDGLAIMGGRNLGGPDAPDRPETPVLHVTALAVMGGVNVKRVRARAETGSPEDPGVS